MNRYISDYTVFQRRALAEIENCVKHKIKDGWEPIGGIAIDSNGLFYQTMVKYSIEYSRSTGPG
jgi:hypothetical protein